MTQQLNGRRGAVFSVRLTEAQRDELIALQAKLGGPKSLGPWVLWRALGGSGTSETPEPPPISKSRRAPAPTASAVPLARLVWSGRIPAHVDRGGSHCGARVTACLCVLTSMWGPAPHGIAICMKCQTAMAGAPLPPAAPPTLEPNINAMGEPACDVCGCLGSQCDIDGMGEQCELAGKTCSACVMLLDAAKRALALPKSVRPKTVAELVRWICEEAHLACVEAEIETASHENGKETSETLRLVAVAERALARQALNERPLKEARRRRRDGNNKGL